MSKNLERLLKLAKLYLQENTPLGHQYSTPYCKIDLDGTRSIYVDVYEDDKEPLGIPMEIPTVPVMLLTTFRGETAIENELVSYILGLAELFSQGR